MLGQAEREWSGRKEQKSVRERQKRVEPVCLSERLGQLKNYQHVGVGEGCVATDG